MKVREIKTGRVYEVMEESATYYIVPGTWVPVAMPKGECEPIPVEPTWSDVTAECEAATDGLHGYETVKHKGLVICTTGYPSGYRLRKVDFRLIGEPLGVKAVRVNGKPVHTAFLIERKDP